MLFGYPNGVKKYRLWARYSEGFEIITSRNVTFNEPNIPHLSNRETESNFEVEEVRGTKLQEELEPTLELTHQIQADDGSWDEPDL